MAHLYKRLSTEQLKEEEALLREKLAAAEAQGATQQILIQRRKIEIVQSFMLDRQLFTAGDVFTLKDVVDHHFLIDEIVGVIAWGYLIDPQTREKVNPTDRIAKLFSLLGKQQA